jgi:hypothetical protein
MNLLHLAPDILEELLLLPRVVDGHDPIHEKMLRRVCGELSFGRQRRLWEVIKKSRAGVVAD